MPNFEFHFGSFKTKAVKDFNKWQLCNFIYLIFTSSSSLWRRSSLSSSSDTSEGFWKTNKWALSRALFKLSSSVVRLCKVWGQGTTSNPKGCSIPMWWRQSGQVNTVLFCPLYFLLVHINTSPRGGATCYKSTVHFYFLNLRPTQTPNVLDVIFGLLLVSRKLILSVLW